MSETYARVVDPYLLAPAVAELRLEDIARAYGIEVVGPLLDA
jgi:hypothetical protein